MPFVKNIVNHVTSRRHDKIKQFSLYPEDVQQKELKNLLKEAQHTEWGKKHEFKTLDSYAAFKNQLPIQSYEDIKPEIEKIKSGQHNLLWPSTIKWFAKSSGTTNDKSKFIPVSKETLWRCHYKGAFDVMAIYQKNYPDNHFFKGKGLTLGGSQKINKISAGNSYYGDLSAILIHNIPWWFRSARTPKPSIALMDEWEAKIEKIAQTTIKENITSIAGVPSWYLVLIKRILEITKTDNLLDVWPNLEVFIHGGVNFAPYREQYQKLIPSSQMHYQETYNASEGFFAIQDDPTSSAMLLMLDYGIFYEFIPIEDIDKENPRIFSIADVELEKNYALVISTNSGLWRYIVGDTVKFVSKYPHRIVITGRTKHFINAFGEEVMVDNAEKALMEACKKTNAIVSEFTAAPVFISTNNKGKHQWLVEFDKLPDEMEVFVDFLDKSLQEINSDYEAKRYKDLNLEKLEVVIARKNLFVDWFKEKGKLGGQNKVPRLSNNRQYIDVLLEMNNRI